MMGGSDLKEIGGGCGGGFESFQLSALSFRLPALGVDLLHRGSFRFGGVAGEGWSLISVLRMVGDCLRIGCWR